MIFSDFQYYAKNISRPPIFFRVARREISQAPWRAKNRHPLLEGYAKNVFRVARRNSSGPKFFRVARRDPYRALCSGT